VSSLFRTIAPYRAVSNHIPYQMTNDSPYFGNINLCMDIPYEIRPNLLEAVSISSRRVFIVPSIEPSIEIAGVSINYTRAVLRRLHQLTRMIWG